MARLDTYSAQFGPVVACTEALNDLPEQKWYATYTSANRERRVASQLLDRGFEHFLPTFSSVRRWKDRRVTLQLPLFPGYVFVRMTLQDRLRVVQIPGVARLVGFNGMPSALPQEEVEALKRGFASGIRAEPHPFLKDGQRVRVTSGPLTGTEGILLRWKNQCRLVVSLELIQRSVAVHLGAADVEAVSN